MILELKARGPGRLRLLGTERGRGERTVEVKDWSGCSQVLIDPKKELWGLLIMHCEFGVSSTLGAFG